MAVELTLWVSTPSLATAALGPSIYGQICSGSCPSDLAVHRARPWRCLLARLSPLKLAAVLDAQVADAVAGTPASAPSPCKRGAAQIHSTEMRAGQSCTHLRRRVLDDAEADAAFLPTAWCSLLSRSVSSPSRSPASLGSRGGEGERDRGLGFPRGAATTCGFCLLSRASSTAGCRSAGSRRLC